MMMSECAVPFTVPVVRSDQSRDCIVTSRKPRLLRKLSKDACNSIGKIASKIARQAEAHGYGRTPVLMLLLYQSGDACRSMSGTSLWLRQNTGVAAP